MLVEFRQSWLHPEGVGITISEKMVKKRTLTNLYNALTLYRENYKGKQHSQSQWKKDADGIITLEDIETLDYIHAQLDQAAHRRLMGGIISQVRVGKHGVGDRHRGEPARPLGQPRGPLGTRGFWQRRQREPAPLRRGLHRAPDRRALPRRG